MHIPKQIEVDAEFYIQLELIVTILGEFETLNDLIIEFIGDLLGEEELSFVLFGESYISFRSIVNNFKKLYKYRIKDKNTLDKFVDLSVRLLKCSEYRNTVAHLKIFQKYSINGQFQGRSFINSNRDVLSNKVLDEHKTFIQETLEMLIFIRSEYKETLKGHLNA